MTTSSTVDLLKRFADAERLWVPDAPLRRPWWSEDTVAVVTGANKGLGLEMARQLAGYGVTVVLTARDRGRGTAALNSLQAAGLKSVWFHPLDTLSYESTETLATWLKKQFGGIDILINNAGVVMGSDGIHSSTYENVKQVIDTNYYGTKNVTKRLLPLLRPSPAGARIVNNTSRSGLYSRLRSESLKEKFRDEGNYSEELADSLAEKYLGDAKAGRLDEEGWVPGGGENGPYAYGESKMFQNVYAAGLAKALSDSQPEGHKIFVVGFCPGICETDMFTEMAAGGPPQLPPGFWVKTVVEGADTGVWLALLPLKELGQTSGKLFGERKEYPFGLDIPQPN